MPSTLEEALAAETPTPVENYAPPEYADAYGDPNNWRPSPLAYLIPGLGEGLALMDLSSRMEELSPQPESTDPFKLNIPTYEQIDMGLGALPMALGMFGGPSSKMADLLALDAAKSMAAKSAAREAIYDATKWFEHPYSPGDWRYVIPDSSVEMKLPQPWDWTNEIPVQPGGQYSTTYTDIFGNQTASVPKAVEEILSAPGVFEAYPSSELLPGGIERGWLKSDIAAKFDDDLGKIIWNAQGRASDIAKASTFKHELSHAIQEAERMQKGGYYFTDPREIEAYAAMFKKPSIYPWEDYDKAFKLMREAQNKLAK